MGPDVGNFFIISAGDVSVQGFPPGFEAQVPTVSHCVKPEDGESHLRDHEISQPCHCQGHKNTSMVISPLFSQLRVL